MTIEKTKILISDEELQLACNSEWILTKHKITGFVFQLLGSLAENIKIFMHLNAPWVPQEAVECNAKIFKGENYLLLPYVLLDYPRCFVKENVFAIRTMFWWGNFFSTTLQLDGRYKKQFEKTILANLHLPDEKLFICTGKDKWEHHFGKNNYTCLKDLDEMLVKKIIEENEFIKIAIPHPLREWDSIPGLLEADYKLLLLLMKP
jgi:hypothetical protein